MTTTTTKLRTWTIHCFGDLDGANPDDCGCAELLVTSTKTPDEIDALVQPIGDAIVARLPKHQELSVGPAEHSEREPEELPNEVGVVLADDPRFTYGFFAEAIDELHTALQAQFTNA